MENPQVTGPNNVTVRSIVKNLTSEALPRYIAKLEEAKNILKAFNYELEGVSTRITKSVDSAITRQAMGEDELDSKKAAIADTLSKLEVHQVKSLERLRNG